MDFKKMQLDDIIKWCVENKQVDWLKKEAEKKYTTKEGLERNITFVELKYSFARKFMPEIVPVAKKPKTVSMFDKIKAL